MIIAVNFPVKQLERRSVKKIRASLPMSGFIAQIVEDGAPVFSQRPRVRSPLQLT